MNGAQLATLTALVERAEQLEGEGLSPDDAEYACTLDVERVPGKTTYRCTPRFYGTSRLSSVDLWVDDDGRLYDRDSAVRFKPQEMRWVRVRVFRWELRAPEASGV